MVFKPGQSGNPGGRPKNRFVSDALKEKAKEEGAKLALALWKTAISGDVKAIQIVLDRVEGKVVEHVVTTSAEDILEALEEAESKIERKYAGDPEASEIPKDIR
jgi:hypothetical protein